jgi:hypothetical protein
MLCHWVSCSSCYFEDMWCLQRHSQAVQEDEGTMILWNVRNYSPKRLESSATPLWEFQILCHWVHSITVWAVDLDPVPCVQMTHGNISQSLASAALLFMLTCFPPLLSPKSYSICSYGIIIHFNYLHIGTWSTAQIINLMQAIKKW